MNGILMKTAGDNASCFFFYRSGKIVGMDEPLASQDFPNTLNTGFLFCHCDKIGIENLGIK